MRSSGKKTLPAHRQSRAYRACASCTDRKMEGFMRTWKLAGAFDAGHIRGWSPDLKQELNFHQLELTGHAEQLETDYQLLREEFGLRLFRDGAWLARSFPGPDQFDWSYLDRLAELSQG